MITSICGLYTGFEWMFLCWAGYIWTVMKKSDRGPIWGMIRNQMATVMEHMYMWLKMAEYIIPPEAATT